MGPFSHPAAYRHSLLAIERRAIVGSAVLFVGDAHAVDCAGSADAGNPPDASYLKGELEHVGKEHGVFWLLDGRSYLRQLGLEVRPLCVTTCDTELRMRA